MRIYRVFRNVGQLLVAVLLFLIFVPFLPPTGPLDSTAIIALVALTVVLSILSWGLLRPAFHRASSAFLANVVLMDNDREGAEEAVACEEG
jgi:hypothetical protein